MEAKQIYALMPKVMAEVGEIGKEKKNTQQGYNFRGIDDALNHCSPILAKHGVAVTVNVRDRNMERRTEQTAANKERTVTYCDLLMDVSFHAADGSCITNTLAGEGMDYGGDKATNKAMAAAMKYGLFFGLVIPVDAESVDDSDRDAKQPERPRQQPKAADTKPPAAAKPTPVADDVRTVLKAMKPKADEWDMLVDWISDGTVKTAATLKDEAAAASFQTILNKKLKTHAGESLLVLARAANSPAAQGI